ncbi:hypothetical protein X975_13371, partial [Stegodyphus mimosarum]
MHMTIKENPLITVIVTPIMQRAHDKPFSGDIVFVNTSGSCDQTNTCVTFMFTATKIGAIPLACILHSSQTEETYVNAFSTFKQLMGDQAFGGKGEPDLFM